MNSRLIILAAVSAVLVPAALGQTVSVSESAPASEILSYVDDGIVGIDTALFDEDASGNHARGQLFSLPDGEGISYEITGFTVKKSSNQTFVGDVMTLRVFEGSADQWDSGTGHSSAVDGADYYVGTQVAPLHQESFSLNMTISDNDFVTFELATP
ncbi:MAG: hypothetical protein ACQKBU_04980, partial [Verrucomicrobiales bacterium]